MNKRPHTQRDDDLTLQEVADSLGVHYMTAYRYVRTGRIAAKRVGTGWRVPRSSMNAIQKAATPGRSKSSAQVRRRRYEGQLSACLVEGDEAGAWRVTQDALTAAFSLEDLYIDLLSATMRRIGDEWAAGRVTVAQEHRATALMYRLVGRLGPGFIRRGRTRGVVLLGAPAGDHHGLATALVADPLRGRRFSVADLGADTPASSFAETVAKHDRVVGVGIVSSAPLDDAVIADAITAIRARSTTPILLGGLAIRDEQHATELGAHAWSNSARVALEWFDALHGH
ncbi:MAG: B12-binding domain-containing protein [Acidimicrobiales bacterium]